MEETVIVGPNFTSSKLTSKFTINDILERDTKQLKDIKDTQQIREVKNTEEVSISSVSSQILSYQTPTNSDKNGHI